MHRPKPAFVILLFAFLTAAACSRDPKESDITAAIVAGGDFPDAYARRSCGPADGPAVRLVLAATLRRESDPPQPSVVIDFYQSIDELRPGRYPVGDAARLHVMFAENGFTNATAGEVHLQSVHADGTLRGVADVSFGSRRIVQPFVAEYQDDMTGLCG